jgi:hypothetical protein
MSLLHLTFLGQGKEPACIEFSPRLTVIHGASDTGKSYVVEAVDFMLGATTLKPIPEAQGYSVILLGVRFADGDVVTLARSPEGGKIKVYDLDLRSMPVGQPFVEIAPKHSPSSEKNISRYLLQMIGLDGYLIRRNARNETNTLSFRNLVRLCLVSETQMQSKMSPVLGGQVIQETAEKAVFRCLLNGRDDSSLIPLQAQAEKQMSKGKLDLLSTLIEGLEAQLDTKVSLEELRQQLQAIDVSIRNDAEAIEGLLRDRSIVSRQRVEVGDLYDEQARRLAEVTDLISRFGILRDQYESDLARLEMVREAGTLLGYFRSGTCVFCGAAPEHQQHGHADAESTLIAEAVEAEQAKTGQLLSDLLLTIEDLAEQRMAVDSLHAELGTRLASIDQNAAALDAILRPRQSDITAALKVKSFVEKNIALRERIGELVAMRASLSTSSDPENTDSPEIDDRALSLFEQVIGDVLRAWRVPDSGDPVYDADSADIQIGGRPRSSRGKGMRAILHAAFTVALAEYCFREGRGHPGFAVLDSPVVTYRDPEASVDGDPAEEVMSENVAHYLYTYLNSIFPWQSVVVENVDPPATDLEGASVYKFSGTMDGERFGFFPRA